MANDYFDSVDSLRRFTLAKASDVNGLFNLVETGFDRLPSRTALAQDMQTYCVAGGTATALTAALPQTLPALIDGVRITVKITAAATGAATLNVDGLGPRAIIRADGTSPESGEWQAGDVVVFLFARNSWVIVSETGYVGRKAAAAAASASAAFADLQAVMDNAAIVAADKATVAADKAIVRADQQTVAADKATVAADKATTLGYKNTVNTDKGIVAADKATVAADKATVASDKATVAADKNAAAAQAAAALASANAAASSYDQFDDRYLGAKASNPTVDNDGNALIVGALYFNTTVPEMRVRTATAWISTGYNSENIDVNGGQIDGTAIGANAASTGKFTTLTTTGAATIGGTLNGRNLSADGSKLDAIEAGAKGDQTAAEILALLKTVDVNGTGGVNAGTLNGVANDVSNVGGSIAQRDSNGDIKARLFRSEWTSPNASVNFIMTQVATGTGDNYIRPSTPAQVLAGIGAVPTSRTITAGNGLSGGGTLAANRTIQVNGGDGIDTTGTAVKVDSTVARTSRNIAAGNGLSGGGTLAADRTISLVGPGTITATSGNSVTAGGHTHSLQSDAVRINYAETTVNEVGSVALLRHPTNGATRTPGFATAGSNLVFANASGLASGVGAAGTWRLMGQIDGADAERQTSLWLRFA